MMFHLTPVDTTSTLVKRSLWKSSGSKHRKFGVFDSPVRFRLTPVLAFETGLSFSFLCRYEYAPTMLTSAEFASLLDG